MGLLFRKISFISDRLPSLWLLTPLARAILRVGHWVGPGSGLVASLMIGVLISGEMVRLRPLRWASRRPFAVIR